MCVTTLLEPSLLITFNIFFDYLVSFGIFGNTCEWISIMSDTAKLVYATFEISGV